jgi:hypothetical protein
MALIRTAIRDSHFLKIAVNYPSLPRRAVAVIYYFLTKVKF